ncbi:MAG: hypothetical protein ACXW05_04370 [Gemmatirosa sp.]
MVESIEQVADRTWAATRSAVAVMHGRGEAAQADSLLTDFRAQFAGTPAATEALFWRALIRADPVSALGAARAADADLAAYQSADEAPLRAPAGVVRRLLAQSDSLRQVVTATRTAAALLIPRDSLKPRDEEIVRLRAELEQARAELDRVRRRLAPPRRP